MEIPNDIIEEIIQYAEECWPDDKDMRERHIEEEKEAYVELQTMVFGSEIRLKEELIEKALEIFPTWCEALQYVEEELSAFRRLKNFAVLGINDDELDKWKNEARRKFSGEYAEQFEFIADKVKRHFQSLEIRQQIDPIKELLIEMEEIIGKECCNIVYYTSDGGGVTFRYPVTFSTGNREYKKSKLDEEIPSEVLVTGYYAFGTNQLYIFRALTKIIHLLKEKYNLDI